jgi:phosphoribosylanthranilate isomerase
MDIKCKFCGLTSLKDIKAAADAGASYVGFVFFSKSPRNLEIETAELLMKATPPNITKVGLIVDADNNFIDNLVSAVDLDMLQLHGSETRQRVLEIKERYRLPIMKAVGIGDLQDIKKAESYGEVVDQLLLDAKPNPGSDLPGGNGMLFDWELLTNKTWQVPWMLAGGLTPDNVASAIKLSGANQVDVSSGIETAPGKNSSYLMAEFVKHANI